MSKQKKLEALVTNKQTEQNFIGEEERMEHMNTTKSFYIWCQGGTGLNAALASFISWIKVNGDANGNKDYKFYVCSPYSDIFEACPHVDGVYKPEEIKDFIFDANTYEGELILHRLYDMNGFVKKQLNYSQAWAKLMNIPFTDTEKGTKVKSILDPYAKYPVLKQQVDELLNLIKQNGFKDYVIMQFTGGQSPLVKVPTGQNGKPDWSKVPYNYEHEPLKRHYPIDKAQRFIELYHEKNPKTAIVLYQLPNEPMPDAPYVVKATIPYLAYYELAKGAKEIVCIDSSLQHLTAGLTKTTVIFAHSKPEAFGYSYNNNIEQKCRTNDLLYFSMLGSSGAKVEYIEPEELLKEVDNYLFEVKSK